MITGQEQPDSGTLAIGETVTMGYVDQSRRNKWEAESNVEVALDRVSDVFDQLGW